MAARVYPLILVVPIDAVVSTRQDGSFAAFNAELTPRFYGYQMKYRGTNRGTTRTSKMIALLFMQVSGHL
jgi:hypothetical protein